jgi:hypothetical protein
MGFPKNLIFRTSARAILVAGVIVFTSWFSLPTYAAESGHDVIGRWKFTAVLDGTKITSMDEKEARRLLGHVMTIRKEGAKFDKEVCGHPDFVAERVEPDLYLKRADPYVTASSLKLRNPVTVVDISCTSVFIRNKNRLVIFWKGFYFDAVRMKN